MPRKQPEFKTKKLYYRRAKWEGQSKRTLQEILVDSHAKLDTVGKRTFPIGSGAEIQGANVKVESGLYLQIASYVPGEATSIIDKDATAKNSSVTAQIAPSGKDYLNGDIFVYINGNHLILCPSGVRENLVEIYIYLILQAVDEKDIASTFELDKVAKVSKLKMIKDEGVKEIELRASLYEASLIHLNKGKPKVSGIQGAIAHELSALFCKDPELKDIREKENLSVSVVLRVDGNEAKRHSREIGFGDAGKKRLRRTAEFIINEFETDGDDGFVIVTGANNKITSDEIRVSDSFKVSTLGKSLSLNSAWAQLKEYFNRLNDEGVLKQ